MSDRLLAVAVDLADHDVGLFLRERGDESAVVAVADRLKTATEAPLLAGGAGHTLSASIGIALGQDNPDALMRDADAALYRAKAGGRGGVEFSRRP